MPFTIDLSDHFEKYCLTWPYSATLRTMSHDTPLTKVMRQPYTIRELDPTNAQVLKQGTLFIWSKKRSVAPPLGSVLIDDQGTYWTVYRLTNKETVETYEAFCLNLSIATAPNDTEVHPNTATIEKATYGKGEANEALATWAGYFTGNVPAVTDPTANPTDTVTARFQPSMEDSKIQFDSEYAMETYRVTFAQKFPVELAGGDYRLADSLGNRYRIMKYFDEGRIDRFPVAIAVRIVEGLEYTRAPQSD